MAEDPHVPGKNGPSSTERRRLRISEVYRPLMTATLLMLSVFGVGVAGYTMIHPEHSILDAVYMTVITLTTVGFGEHIDMTGRPAARVFTIFLLFGGVGTFVYFFSSLTEFVVSGNLERLVWRRKMQKSIAELRDHYVVCGGGATGRHIVRELAATRRPFVLIERGEDAIQNLYEELGLEFPVVIGDATEDRALLEAGVERAQGLFASIGNDKENLIVTVSARMLNPGIRIVSKCIDSAVVEKIRKAGASVVVSPALIGGLRMVSEMVRPTVVSFLDVMLRDQDRRLRFEESAVAAGSSLDGSTVGKVRKMDLGDLLLVAIRSEDGDWIYNPPDATSIEAGIHLVYMGSPDARVSLERFTQRS